MIYGMKIELIFLGFWKNKYINMKKDV
ncbi:hypothetical protein A5875_004523, partial [Enterococcus sp. 3H8_DIV0648]